MESNAKSQILAPNAITGPPESAEERVLHLIRTKLKQSEDLQWLRDHDTEVHFRDDLQAMQFIVEIRWVESIDPTDGLPFWRAAIGKADFTPGVPVSQGWRLAGERALHALLGYKDTRPKEGMQVP